MTTASSVAPRSAEREGANTLFRSRATTTPADQSAMRERGQIRWTSASCCRPIRRPGGRCSWPSWPRRTASTTCGRSTRHLLWQEPYVIYSQILARTKRVIVGPMVTNPATRDWTVTASVFATLNEMYGNRTVCGIGRGDSAVRVTNGKPTTVREMREATHVIRELANCRPVDYKGSHAAVPVGPDLGARGLGRRVRAAGPQDGRRGRRRLHPAAGRRRHRGVDDQDRARGRGQRPAATRTRSPSASPRRPTSGRLGAHARPVPLVRRHGRQPRRRHRGQVRRAPATIPQALTDYIKGREGYDYNEHGRAGNTHTAFVPDEIVDRFCLLGTAGGSHRQAEAAQGDRRRPVRRSTSSTTTRRRRSGCTARRSCPAPRARHREGMREAMRAELVEAPFDRLGHWWTSAGFGLGVLGLVILAAIWELYKALGPEDGRGGRRSGDPAAHQRPGDAARLGDGHPAVRTGHRSAAATRCG